MPFVHGSQTGVLVGQFNLTQYFNQFSASRGVQTVQMSMFGNQDEVYIAGIEDGSLALGGGWDGSVDAVDEELDAAIVAQTPITVGIDGIDTIGNNTVMLHGREASYQIRGPVNDAVRINASFEADGGLRTGGELLKDHVAETATSTGYTSVDNTASTPDGGVSHLHVTAFSGTDATVTIEDSPDDAVFATLITFAAATGLTSERLTVAGTVDRHLRATLAGTFTSVTFAVSFARNQHA